MVKGFQTEERTRGPGLSPLVHLGFPGRTAFLVVCLEVCVFFPGGVVRGEDADAAPVGPSIVVPDLPVPTFHAVTFATSRDLLTTIARRYGAKLSVVEKLNPGLTIERLMDGDAVRVPARWDWPPLPPERHKEIARGPRGRREVALTFDAGWVEPEELDRLLEVLARHQVAGTFFLTGYFVQDHPDGAARIAQAGHPFFNHSLDHPHFTDLSPKRMREELLALEAQIADGSPPDGPRLTTRPFWRPPYGDRDRRVLWVAGSLGFQSVYWTVDSLDWVEEPQATPGSVFSRVCKRPFERAQATGDPDPLDGAIVLFHVSAAPTPQALEQIIPHLRQRGYSLVDVPSLLRP